MRLEAYLYFILYVLQILAKSLQWMFSPPYYLGILPIIIIGAGAVWIVLHSDENRKQWDKLARDTNGLDYSTLFLIAGGAGAFILIGTMITLMVSDANAVLESLSSWLMSQLAVHESMESTPIKNIPSLAHDFMQCLFFALLFFTSLVFTWEGIGGLYGKEFWKTKSTCGDIEKSTTCVQGYIYRMVFLVNFIVAWRFFRIWYGFEDAFILPGCLFCIGYTLGVIFLIACMNAITERTGIAQDDEERRKRISVWLIIGCLILGTAFLVVGVV